MFKNPFKSKKTKSEAMCRALDAMEQELMALEDIMDIFDILPVEEHPPFYLCRRVNIHVKDLRQRFEEAWKV